MRKPDRTKNMSTPTNPPANHGSPAWKASTAPTAMARIPSMSSRSPRPWSITVDGGRERERCKDSGTRVDPISVSSCSRQGVRGEGASARRRSGPADVPQLIEPAKSRPAGYLTGAQQTFSTGRCRRHGWQSGRMILAASGGATFTRRRVIGPRRSRPRGLPRG